MSTTPAESNEEKATAGERASQPLGDTPPAQPTKAHATRDTAIGCLALSIIVALLAWGGVSLYHHLGSHSSASPGEAKSESAAPLEATDVASKGDVAEVVAFDVTKLDAPTLRKWIETVQDRREAALAKFAADQDQYPVFNISGEIRDRDETTVAVWGFAIPDDPRHQNDLGASLAKTNLTVEDFDKNGLLGGQVYHGQHFFIRKDKGTNAFGAAVPVRIYGPMPEQLKKPRDDAERFDALLGPASAKLIALTASSSAAASPALAQKVAPATRPRLADVVADAQAREPYLSALPVRASMADQSHGDKSHRFRWEYASKFGRKNTVDLYDHNGSGVFESAEVTVIINDPKHSEVDEAALTDGLQVSFHVLEATVGGLVDHDKFTDRVKVAIKESTVRWKAAGAVSVIMDCHDGKLVTTIYDERQSPVGSAP